MNRSRRTLISPRRLVPVVALILAFAGLRTADAHADARSVPARRCPDHRRCSHHGAPKRPPAPTVHTVQVVLTTANLSSALRRERDVFFSRAAPPPDTPVIDVTDSVRYQRFTGVGAAMTDSSAWLIHDELSPHASAAVMQRLFGAHGIRLGFLRVPVGASDYTAQQTPYSYDDLAAGQTDPQLAHFSIAHDKAYIIPTIRQALAANPDTFLLASPWSPPAWMKSNDLLSDVGGSGQFLDQYQGALAHYLVKFLKTYRSHGIRIDAITPQNEPDNWTTYPGMQLSPIEEETFVRFHLAPALAQARLSTEVFGGDVGWGMVAYAQQVAASRAASELTGIATHCYYGSPRVIAGLHYENPSLQEIVSECSPGITPFSTTELEISAFRNWASAVGLWNLALNTSGGPVQQPNYGCPVCTGLMTINEISHTVTPTVDYFDLGQVSKFVDPGARRIKSNTFVTYVYPPSTVVSAGLDDVAFRNPDGSEVLVCYDNAPTSETFAVRSHGRYFTHTLRPGATITFIWKVQRAQRP